jgi:hypothetical protein
LHPASNELPSSANSAADPPLSQLFMRNDVEDFTAQWDAMARLWPLNFEIVE